MQREERPSGPLTGESLSYAQLAERLSRLQELTSELSRSGGVDSVIRAVLSTGSFTLGFDEAWVCLLDEEDQSFEVVAHSGASGPSVDLWQRFPRKAHLPASDALDRDELVVWESLADRDRDYPMLRETPMAHSAYVVAPMIVEGTDVGALILGFADARTFATTDRAFIRAAVDQAAQALLRARLLDKERRAHRWQRFLADASLLLSRLLHQDDVLTEVAALAVPTLADACLIQLVDSDGLRTVAAKHADTERDADLASMVACRPYVRNPYILEVAASRKSLLLPTISKGLLDHIAEDDEHRATIDRLGVTGGLCTALVARGHTLGTLTLLTTDHAPRRNQLGSSQLAIAEDLAGRAALAIDNGRLFDERGEVARVLQQALLPPALPAVSGVDLAARHQPATELLVGGDFYDVIDNGDGSWTVLIGDVCGKDAAAATLTGLARHTARGATARHESPQQVLEVMNTVFCQHEADEQFCTAICARVEETSTGVTVEIAVAGHPPPVLIRAGGKPELLGGGGQPIGLFPDCDVEATRLELDQGDALLLYTDGVTEARRGDEMLEEGGLLSALGGRGATEAGDLADCLLDAIAAYQGPTRRDDIAILILRADQPDNVSAARAGAGSGGELSALQP